MLENKVSSVPEANQIVTISLYLTSLAELSFMKNNYIDQNKVAKVTNIRITTIIMTIAAEIIHFVTILYGRRYLVSKPNLVYKCPVK